MHAYVRTHCYKKKEKRKKKERKKEKKKKKEEDRKKNIVEYIYIIYIINHVTRWDSRVMFIEENVASLLRSRACVS